MKKWKLEDNRKMKDDQIRRMVDRFLGWRLPENFNPDGGISFERNRTACGYTMKNEPTGTNLFDAIQAEQMIRYLVDEMPDPTPVPPAQEISITQQRRGRPVTHEEAKESARRLINSHFKNPERARCSIHANPADDDLIITDYIQEQSTFQQNHAGELVKYKQHIYELGITLQRVLDVNRLIDPTAEEVLRQAAATQ